MDNRLGRAAFDRAPAPQGREAAAPPSPNAPGYLREAMARLLRQPVAVAALLAIAIIALMALVGPAISGLGYDVQRPDRVNLPPRIPGLCDGSRWLVNRRVDSLQDPALYPEGSVLEIGRRYEIQGVALCDVRVDAYAMAGLTSEVNYWFGTDYLGRDLWTRTWYGVRISLLIALASVGISVVLGTLYGAVAGYFGGPVDMLLMRFSELIGAFPQTIVAVLLIMLMGSGIRAIILAMALRGWVGTARLVRGQFLRLRGQEYVMAARTLGAQNGRLIFRHILPNAVGPVITRAMIEVPGAIFSEAFLAFIGLGVQAPTPSLGVLISDAQRALITHPTQMVFPAVILSLLMIAFNLLGSALREALDPTRRDAA